MVKQHSPLQREIRTIGNIIKGKYMLKMKLRLAWHCIAEINIVPTVTCRRRGIYIYIYLVGGGGTVFVYLAGGEVGLSSGGALYL